MMIINKLTNIFVYFSTETAYGIPYEVVTIWILILFIFSLMKIRIGISFKYISDF